MSLYEVEKIGGKRFNEKISKYVLTEEKCNTKLNGKTIRKNSQLGSRNVT